MILRAFMEICDKQSLIFQHSLLDKNDCVVATGNNTEPDTHLTMTYNGKEYRFWKKISMIEKPNYAFPYPFSPNIKKIPGYKVTSSGETVLSSYREAATYQKKLFLKWNFLFTVYQYQGRVYHCFKVGFENENDHYYCLKTVQGETLAIIQRHSFAEDSCRATVYLKDSGILELVMLVCANEIMQVQFDITEDSHVVDYSAGNYISIADAEKAMFDKNFIPAVKALDGIWD